MHNFVILLLYLLSGIGTSTAPWSRTASSHTCTSGLPMFVLLYRFVYIGKQCTSTSQRGMYCIRESGHKSVKCHHTDPRPLIVVKCGFNHTVKCGLNHTSVTSADPSECLRNPTTPPSVTYSAPSVGSHHDDDNPSTLSPNGHEASSPLPSDDNINNPLKETL